MNRLLPQPYKKQLLTLRNSFMMQTTETAKEATDEKNRRQKRRGESQKTTKTPHNQERAVEKEMDSLYLSKINSFFFNFVTF